VSAGAKKAEADRLATMFSYATNPGYNQTTADRMGVLGGLYAPSSSYYSVDQGNLTTQRGQDVTAASNKYGYDTQAATTRANTRLTTAADVAKAAYLTPFNPGQSSGVLPGNVAGMFDLPPEDIPARQGLPLAPTDAQVKGSVLQNLPPSDQRASVLGTDVEKYLDPSGVVRFTPRVDAPGAGPAYVPPVSGAKVETQNYITPDGAQGTAWFDPDVKVWKDTTTGQPVDAKITFSGQATDTAGGFQKTTEAQDRNAYAGSMAEAGTKDILNAFDTGALPSQTDYQIFQALRTLPASAAPALIPQMSPQGQKFYQDIRTTLPFQLMSQSGQAVTEQEYERKLAELLPVPGEDPAVTKSRRNQFETYVRTVYGLAGASMKKIETATPPVPEAAQPPAPEAAQPPASAPDAPPAGVDPEVWKFMTPEEKALWLR